MGIHNSSTNSLSIRTVGEVTNGIREEFEIYSFDSQVVFGGGGLHPMLFISDFSACQLPSNVKDNQLKPSHESFEYSSCGQGDFKGSGIVMLGLHIR